MFMFVYISLYIYIYKQTIQTYTKNKLFNVFKRSSYKYIDRQVDK